MATSTLPDISTPPMPIRPGNVSVGPGAVTGNPVLDEISTAHANLSPQAQQAIEGAHQIVGISTKHTDPALSTSAASPEVAVPGVSGPRGPIPNLSPEVPAPSGPVAATGGRPMADAPADLPIPSHANIPLPGMGSPSPSAPMPVSPLIQERSRLNAAPLPSSDPNAHTVMDTGRSGIEQIHNPWVRGLATAGDVIASGVFPRFGQFIPGTSAHHQLLVNENEGAIKGEEESAKSAADVAHTGAETSLEQGQAQHLGDQPPPTLTTDKGILQWNPETHAYDKPVAGAPAKEEMEGKTIETSEGIMQWNPKTHAYDVKVGEAPGKSAATVHVLPDGSVVSVNHDAKTGKSTAEVVYKGDPKIPTEVKQLEINGKPHQVLIESQTGKTIKDLGETGEKPPTVNIANQDHQEQMKGKELLDKAEGQYRQALQGANTLTDFVKSAQSGNKVTAQALPLEGALEITTTAGTKRINRTEVENYAGAGSLWDSIMGKLGKLKSGQPIPKDVQDDSIKLAKILQSNAYKTYKDAHTSAVKRYQLKNEDPLPDPESGNAPQKVSTQDEYGKLPKGAKYVDANGALGTKK